MKLRGVKWRILAELYGFKKKLYHHELIIDKVIIDE